MGLRLYQAPVESDAETKPATDKVAQSRSPIRRRRRYRRTDSAVDRRYVLAAATAGGSSADISNAATAAPVRARIQSGAIHGVPFAAGGGAGATSSAFGDYSSRTLRHVANGSGPAPAEDRDLSVGERWAQYRAGQPGASLSDAPLDAQSSAAARTVERLFRASTTRTEDDGAWVSQNPPSREPRRSARPSASAAEPTYAISNLRSTQSQPSSSQQQVIDRAGPVYLSSRWVYSPQYRGPNPGSRPVEPMTSRLRVTTFGPTSRVGTAQVDGLGDRNRSLSPEGDSVWDTLLSSITPDPQPPSVGSSFASNSASLAAASSGSNNPATSRTSLAESQNAAAAQNAAEPAPEPPCESGCEVSDSDDDDDEDIPPFPTLRRSPRFRAYTEAARGSNTAEDAAESLDDMLRIVRHLARREDIPDEWWAGVGLIRTLSRGDAAV